MAIGHNTAYLTWTDRSSRIVGQYSPTTDTNQWLQMIEDIKLTIAGRHRAWGLVIHAELPDPDEDDSRIITGLRMQEIARSIGATHIAAQLSRYLCESGVTIEAVPDVVTGGKWQYVSDVLESLHKEGSAARRALYEFVGS